MVASSLPVENQTFRQPEERKILSFRSKQNAVCFHYSLRCLFRVLSYQVLL